MDVKQFYAENILPYVERPAQYTGGEMHSLVKDWEQAPVKMAFAFPDSYEIGMSHLGLRLLYEAVNNGSPHLLERVFMPLDDMAAALKKHNLPLATLESGHGLAEFDIIGFTLQYELSYSNILAMLDLAGLPLTAAERGEQLPPIIVGGPAAFNPEPLADIVDAVALGESEELLLELLDLLAETKAAGGGKSDFLRRAVNLPGVYVPAFYEARYDSAGRFAALAPRRDAPAETPQSIKKRIIEDVDAAPYPVKPLLPLLTPVHDRIMLELMRGCTHGCRFCQAGMIYRPRREKSVETLLKQAAAQTAASGYEDIALLSLSSADYSCIEPLMRELLGQYAADGVGISLPSLRVDAFSVNLAARTQEVRKSGITLAPEAGSDRMRAAINKGVTEQDILSAVTAAFSQGYTHIKLYFIIGLPGETEEDIVAIADLTEKVLQLGRRHKPDYVKKPISISLGLASFVPKSHTPFQWQGQDSQEALKAKQDLLLSRLKQRRQVTVNFHDRRVSLLEAAFARGDRRLGPVLLDAYRRGCHFDGWSEHFRFQQWCEAFAAAGLKAELFAEREIAFGEPLPWAHLDAGVREDWLWQENLRARELLATPDCAGASCGACGVCGGKTRTRLNQAAPPASPAMPEQQKRPAAERLYKYRCRMRIFGAAAWLSHLDLLAAFSKALRRAAVPIAFSQGFNPHMQISYGPAHAVGLCSESEYVDLIFCRPPQQRWQEALAAALPPGLELIAAREVAMETPALMSAINYAEFSLLPGGEYESAALDAAIADFLSRRKIELKRVSPKGEKTVDIRAAVDKLHREGEMIRYGLWLNKGAAVKPLELLEQLLPQAVPRLMRRDALFICRLTQDGQRVCELP